MKSLAEINTPLVDPVIYDIAITKFRELQAENQYYKNHHSDAISKGAEAANISFELFQSEMTRRNSVKAYYKRELQKKTKEAMGKKVAEENAAFKKMMESNTKSSSVQLYLFEEPKQAYRDHNDY